MFMYNIRIAALSLRRNPIMSLLMVTAIAVGIGTCMMLMTLRHQMTGNAIPHKSNKLFAVQIDSGDPEKEPTLSQLDVPMWLTYRDATNLIEMDSPAKNQVIMSKVNLYAMSQVQLSGEEENTKPETFETRVTYRSFFSMFDVPFLYGGPWSRDDDDNARQVVVLSRDANETLFGGENSVGKTLVLSESKEYYFEVIGVLDHWNPIPNFYDPTSGFGPEDIFIPFKLAPKNEFFRTGPIRCWEGHDDFSYQGVLNSECAWVIAWAELESEEQKNEYMEFLNNYTHDQKQYGRLQRPTNNYLTSADKWVHVMSSGAGPGDLLTFMMMLGYMFLLICLINTIGLLLAKFLSKSHEISLKRALGANKNTMFLQCLTEVGVIGFTGGLLGIMLSLLGLQAIKALMVNERTPMEVAEFMVHMDWEMMITAVLLATTSSIIAGLFPAWRVCQIPPAQLLRAQ